MGKDIKEGQQATDPKPWEILSSKRGRSYRIFNLRTDRARSPRTGRIRDYFIMESPSWVNVIPLTSDNRVVMIRQYRHGTREVTLEIPGGLVENEDSPETAARRELHEETGYRAASVIPLSFVHPNPALQNNRCYTFLAQQVVYEGNRRQDEGEDIAVVLEPLAEIPRLIREGIITHSLIIVAFYRYFMEYAGKKCGTDDGEPKLVVGEEAILP